MPCYDPLPTGREEHSRETAKFIIYVNDKLEIKTEDEIIELADSAYPEDKADQVTAYLCTTLRMLKDSKPEQFESLVYNAKCKESRKLADWWEEHSEFDKTKEASDIKQ